MIYRFCFYVFPLFIMLYLYMFALYLPHCCHALYYVKI